MPLGANKVALYGASADTGSAVLLSTATASSSASIEFTLPTAYKQVTFGLYNVTPSSNDIYIQWQVSTGSGYSTTITSNSFMAYQNEGGTVTSLGYRTSEDQAQGTGYQDIGGSVGNGSERSGAITLTLYNPASTTYVKNWYSRAVSINGDTRNPGAGQYPYMLDSHCAGYWNTTSALTSASFKFESGNIASGTIKMWGIK